MKITDAQLQAISLILTRKDKGLIAEQAGNSVRTVEAVIQCRRQTAHIQKLIFEQAMDNWNEFGKLLNDIQLNNTKLATLTDYNEVKDSNLWHSTHQYDRYFDIYLQLTSIEYKEISELWKKLKDDYNDILQLQYYCIDLLVRLIGIKPSEAIKYYNKHI